MIYHDEILDNEWEFGRTTSIANECSRRQKTVITDENIAEVQQMMLDDHRIKVRRIEDAINMSTNTC